jgi:endoglucanase
MKKTFFLMLKLLILAALSIRSSAATWYLHANALQDWNTLSIWYSQPLGGGTHPTTISSFDNFDLNGYSVLTPGITSGSSMFGGNQLILHGGTAGYISFAAENPATIIIPNLTSYGGFLDNDAYSGHLAVNITNFVNNANTTLGGGTSVRGLNFKIGTLSGSGDICAIGTTGNGAAGGAILLNVTSATGFTGTLHIADGCQFTFNNAMTSGGTLDVQGSGTEVNLNYTVTFNGVTTNGITIPPGTYTAASLGFSGIGNVVVQPAHSVSRVQVTQLFGVNLPGGGFASGSFYPTDPNEWAYYHGKGLNLIRVAFTWERLQPALNGPLDSTALASLDTAVSLAAARGMSVILDMHNYDSYSNYTIGSTQVPYSAFQNAWQQIAAHFAGKAGIYGYDLMNEPVGDNGTWGTTTAQYGVNGVRQSDTTHYVIVEGENYASAEYWMSASENLNVTDPANKLIYSAHIYFDSNYSGVYNGTYDSNNDYPNIGVDRVAAFIYWLGLKGAKGYIGEFGIPNNVPNPDYRWNILLNNFLCYLNNSGVEGTYWSGGESWGTTYTLSCATGTPPADAPAMSVLQNYGFTNPPSMTFTHSGGNIQLTWSTGTLLEATNLAGLWTTNLNASPYTVPAAAPRKFYRVQIQ